MVRLVVVLTLTLLVGCRSVQSGAANEPVDVEALPEANRRLTEGERTLLEPIFRDGIDYEAVRIIHAAHPFQPADTYMAPNGHIYAPGRLYREDWAAPTVSPVARAELVHEMTHVWQHANGIDVMVYCLEELLQHGGDYEATYPYTLVDGRDLADYGIEQQASILEDHYRIAVEGLYPVELQNRDVNLAERRRLFASVLARFHADARYARTANAR